MRIHALTPVPPAFRQWGEEENEIFETAFRRNYPRLVRFLLRRGADRDLAEDIAQDALLRAFTSTGLDLERPLWPFLKTIASNLLIDKARSSEREKALNPPVCAVPHDPSDNDEVILDALAALPVRQRAALTLKYVEDWKTSDAASYLGLTLPATEQLLFRARRKLRNEYERMSVAVQGLFLFPLRSLRARFAKTGADARGHEVAIGVSQIGAQALSNIAVAIFTTGAVLAPVAAPAAAVAQNAPGTALERAIERSARAGAGEGAHKAPGTAVAALPPSDGESARAEADRQATPDDLVRDIKDPNSEVEQPEDAGIESIEPSPNFAQDRTIFAAGRAKCSFGTCQPVLFVSRDAGATWERLPALSLAGVDLMLPPAFGPDDPRIFVMTPAGLQVSNDGGETFEQAAVAGASYAIGSAAISPEFSSGDPTILIGAQSLMRYDDAQGVVTPSTEALMPGPFEVSYAQDGTFFLGAVGPDATSGTQAVVYRCRAKQSCSKTYFYNAPQQSPQIRPLAGGRVMAFFGEQLFGSTDEGRIFSPTSSLAPGQEFIDLVESPNGALVAATRSIRAETPDSVLISADQGLSWTLVKGDLMAKGARDLASFEGLLLAGLIDGGLACSSDQGVTWSSRCS